MTVIDEIYEEVRKEFMKRGAYFLSQAEKEKVRDIILEDGHINARIVGQPAPEIAKLAGIKKCKNRC